MQRTGSNERVEPNLCFGLRDFKSGSWIKARIRNPITNQRIAIIIKPHLNKKHYPTKLTMSPIHGTNFAQILTICDLGYRAKVCEIQRVQQPANWDKLLQGL